MLACPRRSETTSTDASSAMGTLVRLAATKSCIHGRVSDRTIVKSLFNEFQPHSPAADNPEQLRTTSIEWLLSAAVSAATILVVVWQNRHVAVLWDLSYVL